MCKRRIISAIICASSKQIRINKREQILCPVSVSILKNRPTPWTSN